MAKSESPENFGVLTVVEVAELLDVSQKSVRNWMNDKDLPYTDSGRGRTLNWRDTLRWFIAYKIAESGNGGIPNRKSVPELTPAITETYDSALARKTRAEADLKELELATKRGQVVAVADVKNSIAKVSSSLKTAILGMPSKLSGRIFGVKERAVLRGILDREAAELCRKLMTLGTGKVTDAD